MNLFTIGYEGLGIDGFMSLLSEHGIETVVDVRQLPLSRKPGFSKKGLATALEQAGFDYIHLVALGCPRPVRDDYRTDGDWKRYTSSFLSYLATQTGAIAELARVAKTSDCALLCYEADFNFCHRSMVADAMREQYGAQVEHISVKKAAIAARQRLCA